MKSQSTLVSSRTQTHAQVACFASEHFEPENWPTLDEMPEADTSDLVQAGQYQSTIDQDFELQ